METAASVAAPDEIPDELARLGETRIWESGTVVVAQGDVADCLYVVHSGELRAVVTGDGGRRTELNTPGTGDLFGEPIISGERRAASVEVTSRARPTRVTRAEFERALATRPGLALHLISRLVERVRVLTSTVARLTSVDVYGRVVGMF